MTAVTPRDAIVLAIATIERLERHAPGSAQGTLHVLRDTLVSIDPPVPDPELSAYWVIITDQHGDVIERRQIGAHEHIDCQEFADGYAEQAEFNAVLAPAGTGDIVVYITTDADMVPRVNVSCFTSMEFFLEEG